MPDIPPAAQGQGQQPPFGSTQATGPTPNRGYEAAAMQRLGLVVKQLEALIPLAGSGSDIGKDVLKALNILVKHVPAGAASPAAERNNIEQMAMRNSQAAQMGNQLRQMQQQQTQKAA